MRILYCASTFQSTLPRGSDTMQNHLLALWLLFQSTLPRGSDKGDKTDVYRIKRFQSTLPRGSDMLLRQNVLHWFVHFNPRSLAGATFNDCCDSSTCWHFNPRSLAGATLSDLKTTRCCSYFNPRSLAGATRPFCQRFAADIISIHAPSRERQRGS